jgi:hypothetical protein
MEATVRHLAGALGVFRISDQLMPNGRTLSALFQAIRIELYSSGDGVVVFLSVHRNILSVIHVRVDVVPSLGRNFGGYLIIHNAKTIRQTSVASMRSDAKLTVVIILTKRARTCAGQVPRLTHDCVPFPSEIFLLLFGHIIPFDTRWI